MRKDKRTKKPSVGPKAASMTPRPEAESVRNQIRDLMALPPEERVVRVPDVVQAIKTLPPQDASAVLNEAAREWQTALLPLLESLVADEEFASAAAEALGYVRSEAVVPLLQSLDQPDKPKAVVKSARRALHRLKSQGIAVEKAAPPGPAAVPLVGGRRILRSLMSSVDGSGSQFFSILMSAPLSGMESVELVASDAEGIVDLTGVPTGKREYDTRIQEIREHDFSVIDAPASYVLFRVREYEAINRRQDKLPPSDYQIYRDLFHMPGPEYDQPLIYEELDVEAVRSDPSLPGRAGELFETRDLDGWFVPEEQIEPFGTQAMEAEESPIVLSDAAKEERFGRAFRAAAEEIFTPEVRARYKRRLEENAYVLLHTDRAELARVVLACALQLAPDGPPPPEILFVQEIIKRSIALFIAREKRESRIQRA